MNPAESGEEMGLRSLGLYTRWREAGMGRQTISSRCEFQGPHHGVPVRGTLQISPERFEMNSTMPSLLERTYLVRGVVDGLGVHLNSNRSSKPIVPRGKTSRGRAGP